MGEDFSAYMVVTTTPDGKLALDCVTGGKAAASRVTSGPAAPDKQTSASPAHAQDTRDGKVPR
jgi:hypothetical protein